LRSMRVEHQELFLDAHGAHARLPLVTNVRGCAPDDHVAEHSSGGLRRTRNANSRDIASQVTAPRALPDLATRGRRR
jgi:hypothetical protein